MSQNQQTQTTLVEGTKNDAGKARLDLIPLEALEGIARALDYGTKKYAKGNFKKGMDWSRVAAALLRHTFAWVGGEELDPESGLCHLDHIGACITMLLYFKTRGVGRDDR